MGFVTSKIYKTISNYIIVIFKPTILLLMKHLIWNDCLQRSSPQLSFTRVISNFLHISQPIKRQPNPPKHTLFPHPLFEITFFLSPQLTIFVGRF